MERGAGRNASEVHRGRHMAGGLGIDECGCSCSSLERLIESWLVCRRSRRKAQDTVRVSDQRDRFLDHVLRNANNRVILDRATALDLPDWWFTAGAVFQTVWNVLDGREPAQGIDDYDLFYFDPRDLSSEAQDVVIGRAAELLADLDVVVEVCNEARVHLWYEDHFGVPAKAFDSSRDAIDHFASTTCCYAVTRSSTGELDVYAPHGYDDLFNQRLRPNPVLAPREVYAQGQTLDPRVAGPEHRAVAHLGLIGSPLTQCLLELLVADEGGADS